MDNHFATIVFQPYGIVTLILPLTSLSIIFPFAVSVSIIMTASRPSVLYLISTRLMWKVIFPQPVLCFSKKLQSDQFY